LDEIDAFVAKQPALALETAGVAAEAAVRRHDPVARDHESYGVASVRRADRPRRARSADRRGDLGVAARRSARHVAQCPPHLLLEGRSAGVDGRVRQGIEVAGQIVAQTRSVAAGVACRARGRVGSEAAAESLAQPGLAVREVERAEASIARHEGQGPDRGLHAVDP
jgi:hypothetical protein